MFMLINFSGIVMREIYWQWHVITTWPLISQKGLQGYYSAHQLCQHITDDKWGHLLRPQLLHSSLALLTYILPAGGCEFHQTHIYKRVFYSCQSTADCVNRQPHKFTWKLIEATLAPISIPTCRQTCSKTNPRLINMRSNARKSWSKQSLKTQHSIEQYLAATQGNDSNQAATTRLSGEANVQVHLAAVLMTRHAGLYLYQIQKANLIK